MEFMFTLFEENKIAGRVAVGLVVAAAGLAAYRWIKRRKRTPE